MDNGIRVLVFVIAGSRMPRKLKTENGDFVLYRMVIRHFMLI